MNAQGLDNLDMFMNFVQQVQMRGETIFNTSERAIHVPVVPKARAAVSVDKKMGIPCKLTTFQ